jgi:CubicO group peptidase (beta-lactamase class C family)
MLAVARRSLVACFAAALAAQSATTGFDAERLGRIAAVVRGEVENGHHAGASFVVLHRGEEVAAGVFGAADVDTGAALRRDSIVRIYSMTKPITAVAALVLFERGVLRLDSPIRDWLPAFAAPQVCTGGTAEAPRLEPAVRPITVRMLLNHTAGFSYDFYRDSPAQELYRRAGLWDSASLAEFVQKAAALPLVAQPGTAWNYSIADDVLGAVIEAASGMPLPQFVQEAVCRPLGMVDTDYDVPEQKRDRLATVHQHEAGALKTLGPQFGAYAEPGRGFAAGGAGMFSTLDDYARFCRMLLAGGRLGEVQLLSRKTMELAGRDSLGAGLKTSRAADGWGLICAVVRDLPAGHDLGSDGLLHWSGAATTHFFVDPREDLVGIVFAQHMPYDQHRLLPRFRTAVYQALR